MKLGAVFHSLCLTLIIGFGGGLALVFGRRRLAGLLWFGLGAGSLGVAWDRITSEALRFDSAHKPDPEVVDFALLHLPFLILGLILLTSRR